MTVFVCRDGINGILCGVYDAWMSRLGHKNVKLALEDKGNLEMFCEYRTVAEEEQKIRKVTDAIYDKLSGEVYKHVYKASLSQEEGKADKIYRFLVYAFAVGQQVLNHLSVEPVHEIFSICRFVSNEAHFHLEFLRFSQMDNGVLYSRIGPRNDVLSLIAPHFADRLPGENWIIYDVNRKSAAIHRAGQGWLLMDASSPDWQEKLNTHTDEEGYRQLWKAFYTSIAIKERTNPTCQRNHLPLRYRSYMTEFQDPPLHPK